MIVFLTKTADIRNDPGSPLDKPYKTLTIRFSAAPEEIIRGEGTFSARKALAMIRSGKSTAKEARINKLIKANGGAVAEIEFY